MQSSKEGVGLIYQTWDKANNKRGLQFDSRLSRIQDSLKLLQISSDLLALAKSLVLPLDPLGVVQS